MYIFRGQDPDGNIEGSGHIAGAGFAPWKNGFETDKSLHIVTKKRTFNEVINTIQPIGCERLVQTGIIFKCIFENIKNAYMHGLSGCAVMIFARPFPKLKKEKIEISISDVGKGIPYSIY